jgi:hypothetical protein
MNVLIDIAIGSATVAGIVAVIEVTLAVQARRRRAAPPRQAESHSPRHSTGSSDAPRPVAGSSRAAD